MKKIINIIAIGLLFTTLLMPFYSINVKADPGNDLWAVASDTTVTWDDSFYVIIWANIDEPVNGWMMEYINFTSPINATGQSYGTFFDDNGTSASAYGAIHNNTGVIGGSMVDYTYVTAAGGTYQNNVNKSLLTISFKAKKCGTATVSYETPDDTEKILLYAGSGVTSVDHSSSIEVHPYPATSFTASAVNSTKINLAWTRDLTKGVDKVVVFRNATGVASYPTYSSGTEIYNNTGATCSDTGLTPGITYYYSVYTLNNTYAFWSLAPAQDTGTTSGANLPPTITNPNPANNSNNRELSLTWQCDIHDPDGDSITYYINCSNGQTATASGVNNGTRSLAISGLSYITEYKVDVEASDGNWSHDSFNFTTKANSAPSAPSNPSPSNTAPSVPINTGVFSVDVSDPDADAMDVSFYWATNFSLIGTDTSVASGSTASISKPSWLSLNTKYYWYANATDGLLITKGPVAGNWSFTTRFSLPPSQPDPTPSNVSTGVSVSIGSLTARVLHPDGDDGITMDISFYWADTDILIGTDVGVANNTDASIAIGSLSASTNYYWYVNITDSEGNSTRGPIAGNFSFTTASGNGGGGGGGGGTPPDDEEEPTVPVSEEPFSLFPILLIILIIIILLFVFDYFTDYLGLFRWFKKKEIFKIIKLPFNTKSKRNIDIVGIVMSPFYYISDVLTDIKKWFQKQIDDINKKIKRLWRKLRF